MAGKCKMAEKLNEEAIFMHYLHRRRKIDVSICCVTIE
jgi:hypothetical protein